MKKCLILWGVLLTTLLFTGCEGKRVAQELTADIEGTQECSIRCADYKISREEAFASLRDALRAIDGPRTRGGRARLDGLTVESLTLVRGPRTRGTGAQPEGLYYVNFAEGNGFAVLSADRRVCDGPMAIAESGHLEASDFTDDYVGPTEAEIAKDAPGFTWYNAEEDDWYVDSWQEWDNSSGSSGRPERRIAQHMFCEMNIRIDDGERQIDEGGGGVSILKSYGPWTWTKKVGPLVRTKWKQGKFYKKYCPERGCGKKREKAPAGCVSVALSQVLACNEYPANREWWGVWVDWKEVKKVGSVDFDPRETTEEQKDMAAALIRHVGKEVCTIYARKGSFALPISVMRYMRELGYRDVWKRDLDWKIELALYRMLDEGLPAVMAGAGKRGGGHAWVVDGYITRTRTVSYSDGTSSTQREKLLHCNWGWGGTADGYYYYNMFDPGSGPTATDVIDAYGGRDGAKYELCTSVIGYRR